MSFVANLVKAGSVPIYFVTAVDINGKDSHFFVKSTQAKIDAFLQVSSGPLKLTDYGEILASGFGKIPTGETKRIMKEKYDFDVDA